MKLDPDYDADEKRAEHLDRLKTAQDLVLRTLEEAHAYFRGCLLQHGQANKLGSEDCPDDRLRELLSKIADSFLTDGHLAGAVSTVRVEEYLHSDSSHDAKSVFRNCRDSRYKFNTRADRASDTMAKGGLVEGLIGRLRLDPKLFTSTELRRLGDVFERSKTIQDALSAVGPAARTGGQSMFEEARRAWREESLRRPRVLSGSS